MAGVGQPVSTLQGVAAQNVVIAPEAFYPATRRLRFPMKSAGPIAGFGAVDSVPLKQTGIVSALDVRVSGTLVFAGTIDASTKMTWRWPYDLVKSIRVSANGQANLINAKGLWLKALQMTQDRVHDRGITRKVNGVNVDQGTLALSSDDWGTSAGNQLGPNSVVPAAGTYTVDLTFRVPIAFDPKTLIGAIFAQTAQTNLTADLEYALQSEVVTLGGAATLTANLQSEIEGIVYTIPQVGGQFVVPDLSAFHQLIGTRATALAQGENEIMLPGTGIGRQLMRVMFQTWSGAGAAAAPLAVNAANYGSLGWRYGGNDTPEMYRNGAMLRACNEDTFGVDLGGNFGVGVHDWCADWALRDSIDEGATSDLRLVASLVASPVSPGFEFCQQTVFAAPVGA